MPFLKNSFIFKMYDIYMTRVLHILSVIVLLFNKMMQLKPSDILFSQETISNKFKIRSSHSGKLIGETLDDLCEGRCSINDIPIIGVMKRDEKWVTADNRRLWVFRELERLGKCEEIPVYQIYHIDPRKLNSTNGGVNVRVRRFAGGTWHSKPSACGT